MNYLNKTYSLIGNSHTLKEYANIKTKFSKKKTYPLISLYFILFIITFLFTETSHISAQNTSNFIITNNLERHDNEEGENFGRITLPKAQINKLYCLTLKVEKLQNYKNWNIELVSDIEFLNVLSGSSPQITNYNSPANVSITYNVGNDPLPPPPTINFSFTPPTSDSYLFTFKRTEPDGSVYYYPDFFTIEAAYTGDLVIEALRINNTDLADNKIDLEPEQRINFSIKTSAGYGEVNWDIPINTAKTRTYQIKNYSIQFFEDSIIYGWQVELQHDNTQQSSSLRPSQLGGIDRISFEPSNCLNASFGLDTALYVHVPEAKVVAIEDYPNNQLPQGIPDQNYRFKEVSFELTPENVDFRGYDKWQVFTRDKAITNGTFPSFSPSNFTQLKQLGGTPDRGNVYNPLKIKVSHSGNGEPVIESEDFSLVICDGNFDEIPEAYEVVDLAAILPDEAAASNAASISNAGYVAGYYQDKDGKRTNVIWYLDNLRQWQFAELPLPDGMTDSPPFDLTVNDHGHVVGQNTNLTYNPANTRYGAYWRPSKTIRGAWDLVFLLEDDLLLEDINNRNQIVGTKDFETDFLTDPINSSDLHPASYVIDGTNEKRTQPAEKRRIRTINDMGNLVGNEYEFVTPEIPVPGMFVKISPPFFLNPRSVSMDTYEALPSLDDIPQSATQVYEAIAMNNQNRIAGNISGSERAILWEKLGGDWSIIDLQLHGDYIQSSFATGINDLSQVVGTQNTLHGSKGFIYDHRLRNLYIDDTQDVENAHAKDAWIFLLDDLLEDSAPAKIHHANGINNAGWIACEGILDETISTKTSAILLKPKKPYSFQVFDDRPVKINNRNQIIFSKRQFLLHTRQYLWEECLGDISLLSEVIDINDDMRAISSKGYWERIGSNGEESWNYHPINHSFFHSPESLSPIIDSDYPRLNFSTTAISNSNTIVSKESSQSSPLDTTFSIGLVWQEDGLLRPFGSLPEPFADINSSGVTATGMRTENSSFIPTPPPLGLPVREDNAPPGIYDIVERTFSQIGTGQEGEQERITGINDAGIAVGIINLPCSGAANSSRGFLAIPPYTLHSHIREFCDFLPYDINSQGWVVGTRRGTAVVFFPDFPGSLNGDFMDLNTYLSTEDQERWKLVDALGINDAGEVIGDAQALDENGYPDNAIHGFLLKINN